MSDSNYTMECREELIFDGRVPIEFFTVGLAAPWGSAQCEYLPSPTGGSTPGTRSDRDRTLRQFVNLETDLLNESHVKHVLRVYGAKRIIWVDFTEFVSHRDPHLGWTQANITKMTREDDGKKLARCFRSFLNQLRAQPTEHLKEGLACVCCCASGRTRSLGGAAILMQMWKRSLYQLKHFDVICLSRCLWHSRQCEGGVRCGLFESTGHPPGHLVLDGMGIVVEGEEDHLPSVKGLSPSVFPPVRA